MTMFSRMFDPAELSITARQSRVMQQVVLPAPPPQPEVMDPDYVPKTYRLVQVENQQFKLQWQDPDGQDWITYKDFRTSHSHHLTEVKGSRLVMESKAKDIARAHYNHWKSQRGFGNVIELGKLF